MLPYIIFLHFLSWSIEEAKCGDIPDAETVRQIMKQLHFLERELSTTKGEREKQYNEVLRIHNALMKMIQSAEAQIEKLSRQLVERESQWKVQQLCRVSRVLYMSLIFN